MNRKGNSTLSICVSVFCNRVEWEYCFLSLLNHAHLHVYISFSHSHIPPPQINRNFVFVFFFAFSSHSLYRCVCECIFARLNGELAICEKGEMQVQHRQRHNNILALLLVCLSVFQYVFVVRFFSICTKSNRERNQKLKWNQNFCDKIQFIDFFSFHL